MICSPLFGSTQLIGRDCVPQPTTNGIPKCPNILHTSTFFPTNDGRVLRMKYQREGCITLLSTATRSGFHVVSQHLQARGWNAGLFRVAVYTAAAGICTTQAEINTVDARLFGGKAIADRRSAKLTFKLRAKISSLARPGKAAGAPMAQKPHMFGGGRTLVQSSIVGK